MIRGLAKVLAISTALALSGCAGDSATHSTAGAASSALGDTGAVCARWMEAQKPFLLHTAPEAKAYDKAMSDAYQGKKTPNAVEIQRAYWSGWADAIRPLVEQAGTAELKTALTAQITELDRRAAAEKVDVAKPAFTPIQELCLNASGPAMSVDTVE